MPVFVHQDNLLEVKTFVLRHLPVLVYTPNSLKVADGRQGDPTITALYFDNPQFSLYNGKVEKGSGASSLRVRWFGQLDDKPELLMEKKTLCEGDDSDEVRFNIKEKYVMPFVEGEYKMEKGIQKLRGREGEESQKAANLENNASDIQKFILENDLQPVVRASYTRMAFQIPGDDLVRVSIDTNLAFIREDALDSERPCRDPHEWHRMDIDGPRLEFPFGTVRQGEISRFPYAVMEVKVRNAPKRKKTQWVDDLRNSHLVKDAPKFSKFVHGVASLFERYVNSFPFWVSLMDTDIRRDPNDAFKEEQERKVKQREDEVAVGSLIGSMPKALELAVASPAGRSKSYISTSARQLSGQQLNGGGNLDGVGESTRADEDEEDNAARTTKGLSSIFPAFSTSKYARSRRMSVHLPQGVHAPSQWIKDSGPVKVEPKVWMANQR